MLTFCFSTHPPTVRYGGGMSIPLILASKSKPRRDLLFHAGICPTIRVSHVDEPAVVAKAAADAGVSVDDLPIATKVMVLAQAKANAVYQAYKDVAEVSTNAHGDEVTGFPLEAAQSTADSSHTDDVARDEQFPQPLSSVKALPPKENVHQPGDGWVDCACGRKHWGTNGAAGVLLARRDQETGEVTHIVMQHRATWSAEGGTWGIPGGAIADGESPIEGALREAYEEANITPADIEVVGCCLPVVIRKPAR